MDTTALTTALDLPDYGRVLSQTDRPTSQQLVIAFPNGYGASIVRGPYTYGGSEGLFEVGVLRMVDHVSRWELTYDTPVTDDVEGWLSPAAVVEMVEKVRVLPPQPGWEG